MIVKITTIILTVVTLQVKTMVQESSTATHHRHSPSPPNARQCQTTRRAAKRRRGCVARLTAGRVVVRGNRARRARLARRAVGEKKPGVQASHAVLTGAEFASAMLAPRRPSPRVNCRDFLRRQRTVVNPKVFETLVPNLMLHRGQSP